MPHKNSSSISIHRQKLARLGEALAARHLESLGQTILSRNLRTPHGELDLVTRAGEYTVIVEVKTRSSHAFGLPEQAIDNPKRTHLLNAATYYLQREDLLDSPWRIDVVAVEIDRAGTIHRIEVFEHAVRSS
jgi:putative endonuclease